MDLALERFWVMDVEGNGASPPEIVEIALVGLAHLELQSKQMEWLVRPQVPISPAVTRIHGITDSDVADAPDIDDIADDVMTWTDGARIIGHNVRVELDAISNAIPDWQPAMAIDTLKLAKSVCPGLQSYGLEKLGQHFELTEQASRISGKKHHSALYDSVLTALLFIELVTSLPEERRNSVLIDCDLLNPSQGSLL
ncbi:3'-5' exonuclease [Roseinatronobacter monicus]|uniref:Exodeoxyribonuclease X n=1 Tax=Roseinatronobacter monicus TaxID=393481 RepID=A0A543K4D2_9RHOB|nr:3'-5' exonuclease [Roseinatronobacter monicus]TQM89939.1 exodeoxyribonuclease X [Roseinatronobacter monicus]